MFTPALFKWRHFLPEIILLNVRWYCRYCLELPKPRGDDAGAGYRSRPLDDQSLGVEVRPRTDKRIRPHLKPTNDSWRVDETYIKSRVCGNICIVLWIPRGIL
jgi:IS6 family transposase